jgi:hypothetical protein
MLETVQEKLIYRSLRKPSGLGPVGQIHKRVGGSTFAETAEDEG